MTAPVSYSLHELIDLALGGDDFNRGNRKILQCFLETIVTKLNLQKCRLSLDERGINFIDDFEEPPEPKKPDKSGKTNFDTTRGMSNIRDRLRNNDERIRGGHCTAATAAVSKKPPVPKREVKVVNRKATVNAVRVEELDVKVVEVSEGLDKLRRECYYLTSDMEKFNHTVEKEIETLKHVTTVIKNVLDLDDISNASRDSYFMTLRSTLFKYAPEEFTETFAEFCVSTINARLEGLQDFINSSVQDVFNKSLPNIQTMNEKLTKQLELYNSNCVNWKQYIEDQLKLSTAKMTQDFYKFVATPTAPTSSTKLNHPNQIQNSLQNCISVEVKKSLEGEKMAKLDLKIELRKAVHALKEDLQNKIRKLRQELSVNDVNLRSLKDFVTIGIKTQQEFMELQKLDRRKLEVFMKQLQKNYDNYVNLIRTVVVSFNNITKSFLENEKAVMASMDKINSLIAENPTIGDSLALETTDKFVSTMRNFETISLELTKVFNKVSSDSLLSDQSSIALKNVTLIVDSEMDGGSETSRQ